MRFALNLRQLTVFYYVAKNLSFTRAAEELFISQPAVTMQIAALEELYGLPLFSRKKNKLTLTEAGEALFPYAEKLMEIGYQAERVLLNMKANPHGLLRIGTTKTFARYLLTPFILKFREAYPQISIKIDEGSSDEIVLSILYGRNDIAIVGRVDYPERVETFPFMGHESDALVALVPKDHRFAGKKSVSLEELTDEPLILRERGSSTRSVTLAAMDSIGITPKVHLESGNIDVIKDLVEKGIGISILGDIALKDIVDRPGLRIVAVEGMPRLPIDIVLPIGGHRPQAINAFLDIVREDAKLPPSKRRK